MLKHKPTRGGEQPMTQSKNRLPASLLLLCALASNLQGQDYLFTPTLDKNSLEGWTPYYAKAPVEKTTKWKVENGILHTSTQKEPKGHWLISDSLYGDFILRFEFKLIRGNSGINFHSFFGNEDVEGPQADMGNKTSGRIYEVIVKGGKFSGSWLSNLHPAMESSYKANDWNSMEIRVKGSAIQVDFNEKRVTEYTFPRIREKGFLAWQLHSNQDVEFFLRGVQISQWQEVVSLAVTPYVEAVRKGPSLSITTSSRINGYAADQGIQAFGIDGRSYRNGSMRATPIIRLGE